jgi:hypothetical protein
VPPHPESRLWIDALDLRRSDDRFSQERDALRASLAQVRRSSDLLADRIAEDLPEFTIHDGSHLDALWPLFDQVAPNDLSLSPTEAWVLGVAVLLHDLGLAVAAYPGGRDELRSTPGWADARASALRAELGRPPSSEELTKQSATLDSEADKVILRKLHAERAESLVGATWDESRLVEDSRLRSSLGGIAGRIAASHWWSVERLVSLGELEGAPGGYPHEWTVRPILLAVLLRIADAAHLDESRAPRFARAIRELGTTAAEHWDFQERLRQPVLLDERLRFVSSQPFPRQKAAGWWLCFEHLNRLDDELAACDALLQSRKLPRLAARSVQGARDPSVLAQLIEPLDWVPVNATVEVSDLSRLIRRLGGRELYGDAKAVPLRELIQNSCDAVGARRSRQKGFGGKITVRLSVDLRELEVQDDGVGMSEAVLTGALLDFGRSLWESEELASVLPGLQSAGFQPIGRFGIGFFSVFMWADEVTVISRPNHLGELDTKVLEFPQGLDGRPIMREAGPTEKMDEPGTLIRLKLRQGEQELAGLLGVKPQEQDEGNFDISEPQSLLSKLLCGARRCVLDSGLEGRRLERDPGDRALGSSDLQRRLQKLPSWCGRAGCSARRSRKASRASCAPSRPDALA